MVKEAEANAGDDKTRREKIEKRNNLDTMLYQADKTLSENSDKLDPADKKALEDVLADAKKDLESDDDARIDSAQQRVEAELHKMAEKLYKAPEDGAGPAPGAAPGEGAAPGGDEEIIDAEYTEEKGDQ